MPVTCLSTISPDRSFSSGSSTYVLSSCVSSDSVAEPAGWFFGWKRRSGLQMCPCKQELSKRFAIDMGRTSVAVAAAAVVDPGASGEDRSFLHRSGTVKSLLMPESRQTHLLSGTSQLTLGIPGTLLATFKKCVGQGRDSPWHFYVAATLADHVSCTLGQDLNLMVLLVT